LRFNRGLEHIMRDLSEPIIPVYLDRTWHSIWSFEGGKYFFKRPRQLRHPVTVMFGSPMLSSTKVFDVRQKVVELGAQAFRYRLEEKMTLGELFFDEVMRRPFAPCIADSTGKNLNRWQTFVVAHALSRQLAKLTRGQEFVGIFLPTSVASAVTNIAVAILHKPVVNLNYSSGREALRCAVEQTGMKVCVTSRAFLEKLQTTPPCEGVFIEELWDKISFVQRCKAMACVFLMPAFLAHRYVFGSWKYRSVDDLVTVVFTSGSTGQPKGVMLSHANIIANLEGFHQGFKVRSSDVLMGILPFFHSFGFAAVLWLPLASSMRAVYHPSPLDAKVVGDMVRNHRATLMMATPTFLSAYIKRCEPGDFKTIRYTIIGAEKLKAVIADACMEKFGFMPLEGYGCTELSPIVSLNFPDDRSSGTLQKAHKPGTIGNPLPGVAVRIVDPETYRVLGPYEEGLLVVKGQNVMRGYFKESEKTKEAFVDGWYKTGDIAFLDDDGFVTITDRINRFSKIAGEMVPHIRIEEAIHKAVQATEPMCLVAAVPDDRKGEKLVVLTLKDVDISSVREALKAEGLPNLWIPESEMFFRIDAIPVLGSGKLDLGTVKRLARELALGSKA
jgi:acyl-[acyl-carrier-protein]-phospholipid O-acyltransferase/long-chain-fatty-acid--[acyl-carrier-protein] ligase